MIKAEFLSRHDASEVLKAESAHTTEIASISDSSRVPYIRKTLHISADHE